MGPLVRLRGFTLLELLVVVFILAAVAASAIAIVGTSDEQFRYEDTKAKLTAIRRAVLGRADPEAPPSRAIGDGYVADMGQLPPNLAALLEPAGQTPWTIDPDTGIGFGWRGPYLHSLPRADGATAFPDGWGNAPQPALGDLPEDFGWVRSPDDPTAGDWSLRSRGADLANGGAEAYAQDYPPAGSPLLIRRDYAVNIRDWSLDVTLLHPSAASAPFGTELYLQLDLVESGGLSTTPERVALGIAADDLAVGETRTISVILSPGADRWVAWGWRSLRVVEESPTLPGTYVTLGPNTPARIELVPRGTLPASLGKTWSTE